MTLLFLFQDMVINLIKHSMFFGLPRHFNELELDHTFSKMAARSESARLVAA